MTADYISLLAIIAAAAVCPIVAQIVPKKIVPEAVLLLLAGAGRSRASRTARPPASSPAGCGRSGGCARRRCDRPGETPASLPSARLTHR